MCIIFYKHVSIMFEDNEEINYRYLIDLFIEGGSKRSNIPKIKCHGSTMATTTNNFEKMICKALPSCQNKQKNKFNLLRLKAD